MKSGENQEALLAARLRPFLGVGPMATVGHTAQFDENRVDDESRGLSIGSILVLVKCDSMAPTEAQEILMRCKQMLHRGGSVAFLFENRIYVRLARLRAIIQHRAVPAPDAPTRRSTGLSLNSIRGCLKDLGFVNIRTWAASPSVFAPTEIFPLRIGEISLKPAFMLTADIGEFQAGSLIGRIQSQIDASLAHDGRNAGAIKMERVHVSTRGKAIVFFRDRAGGVLVRIPSSSAALTDEDGAFKMLSELQRNRDLVGSVPLPLMRGMVDGTPFYVESRVKGSRLATHINSRNRTAYLRSADRFLRHLNPSLDKSVPIRLAGDAWNVVVQSMLDQVLRHVPCAEMQSKIQELFRDSLHDAECRLGVVHGDFGVNNILVSRDRVIGLIDWETARRVGSPVLDGFNYLDSVRRYIDNVSLVETMPLLAEGRCDAAEEEFLRSLFEYCGIDLKFRRGFALLYFLYHIGFQLHFEEDLDRPRRILNEVFRYFMQRR